MAKLSKRAQQIRARIEPGKLYSVEEAVALLTDLSKVKFVEAVDVAVRLGIDAKSATTYRRRVLDKLGVRSNAELTALTLGAART